MAAGTAYARAERSPRIMKSQAAAISRGRPSELPIMVRPPMKALFARSQIANASGIAKAALAVQIATSRADLMPLTCLARLTAGGSAAPQASAAAAG